MNRVISFHYTLTDPKGKVLDSSVKRGEALSYIEGVGQIIPGLEKQLGTLKTGDKKRIVVASADAYGPHPGHPLAGVDLTFDVELTNIREATPDELSHGHAHGEHGHSH